MSIIQDICRNPNLINDINKCVETNRVERESFSGINAPNFITNKLKISCGGLPIADSVLWEPNKVAVCESNLDVISFSFSGCLMAKVVTHSPLYAHIHCDERVCEDSRYDFAYYLQSNGIQCDNVILFRPICDPGYLKSPDEFTFVGVWGVITTQNECYSILVNVKYYNDGTKEFHLNSIYQHITNRSDDTLYNAIKDFYVGETLKKDENTFKTNRDKLNKVLDRVVITKYTSGRICRIC